MNLYDGLEVRRTREIHRDSLFRGAGLRIFHLYARWLTVHGSLSRMLSTLPFSSFLPASVSSLNRPLVLGILGGIGSGKTSIARGLSQHFRILLLDADQVGHAVLNEADVQAQLRQHFGADVFTAEGTVDRRKLAAQVFGPAPEQAQALRVLNSIVHPLIRSRLVDQIAGVDPDVEVIVLDAAVMLEAKWDGACDALVFVDTPYADRLARVQQRGWTAAELDRREASQISLEEKRQRSQFVIDNSQSLEHSLRQLADFVRRRQAQSLAP